MNRRGTGFILLVMAALVTPVLATTSSAQAPAMCEGMPATIVGTEGNDVLFGTDGDDVIAGLGGNDVIRGFAGNDVICGDNGRDRLFGGQGNDHLYGGKKNDILKGDQGRDTLYGNQGKDRLVGGGGGDTLEGGSGVIDRLTGKGGVDTCNDPQATTTIYSTCELGSQPPTRVVMNQVGGEELVWDWSESQCEPEHIPDIAARAIRDADGNVQLTIGHYFNYRMIGPDLDSVETDCTLLLASAFDPDPATFNDSSWLGGLYTADGQTIYAIVHNEYRGDTHGASRPTQCPSQDRFTCLDTSLTMFVSRDGGDSYQPIVAPPGNLVATLPHVFDDEGQPTGLRQPSNIIAGPDGYFYNFSNISSYPNQDQWVCVIRTNNLEDPTSWRFWTGTAFTGRFINPYVTDPAGADTCAPLALPELGVSVQESVVFDKSIQRFVIIGASHAPLTGDRWGIYFSTSPDLIDWTPRQLIMELPVYSSVDDPEVDSFYAYTSLLDPNSSSRSFDTSNGSVYLYITRFHAGTSSLDRDLVRFPLEIGLEVIPRPDWSFDQPGDTEGWSAWNHLADFDVANGRLTMRSTGDDPYFGVDAQIPAEYDQLHIRMSVSGGGSDIGQLFYGTVDHPDHTEASSLIFDLRTDGRFHDYRLDLSDAALWDDTITSLRLDPGGRSGRQIVIERIWFAK